MLRFKKISGPKITIGFGASSASSFSYRGEPKKPSIGRSLSPPLSLSPCNTNQDHKEEKQSPKTKDAPPCEIQHNIIKADGEDGFMFDMDV